MIGLGRATSTRSTYVVWTALLSSVILGELVTPLILAEALLSVSGIWLLPYERGRWDVKG